MYQSKCVCLSTKVFVSAFVHKSELWVEAWHCTVEKTGKIVY